MQILSKGKKRYILLLTIFGIIFSHPQVYSKNFNFPKIFEPTEEEFNLPFAFKDGKINIKPPKFNFGNIEKIINTCDADFLAKEEKFNVKAKIFKRGKQKYAKVKFKQDEMEKLFPFVFTKTITKEILGQYSMAIDVAHVLGITQVDFLKIYVLDINLEDPLYFINFYDEDGELLDRTIFFKNQWNRCNPN